MYTGQQYYQETGQYYLRVRYYNPVIYYDPSGHNGCDIPTSKEPTKTAGEGGSDVGNMAKKLDTNNIPNMTKQDIIDSVPDDWNYTEHNGFVHIRDADGKIRIRIDPPDKVTNYPHVHAYDSDGNLLDSAGNIVDRKSPDGHIPYKDN